MNFIDPKKIIENFFVSSGSTVADFGAGTGFYTKILSRQVGTEGKVYAVDIQEHVLSNLKKTLDGQRLQNVEVLHSDLEEGLVLKDSSLDAVILSSILFQIKDKEKVVSEAFRVLRNLGRVLLIDWKGSFSGIGPDKDMIVNQQEIISLFLSFGFELDREIDAGKYHFALVFRKK